MICWLCYFGFGLRAFDWLFACCSFVGCFCYVLVCVLFVCFYYVGLIVLLFYGRCGLLLGRYTNCLRFAIGWCYLLNFVLFGLLRWLLICVVCLIVAVCWLFT